MALTHQDAVVDAARRWVPIAFAAPLRPEMS